MNTDDRDASRVATRRASAQAGAQIKQVVKQYFAAQEIDAHPIYRTCTQAFKSLGAPHNLVSDPPVPGRIAVLLDFNDSNVQFGNLRRIIAFPEAVADDLPHSSGRVGKEIGMKIDLDRVPAQYVFNDWADLQTHYRRILATR